MTMVVAMIADRWYKKIRTSSFLQTNLRRRKRHIILWHIVILLVVTFQSRLIVEMLVFDRRQAFLLTNDSSSLVLSNVGAVVTQSVQLSSNNSHNNSHSKKKLNDHKFPRWGVEGISISSLVQFIEKSVVDRNVSVNLLDVKERKSDGFVFPETLYVIDKEHVWVSSTLRERNDMKQKHSNFTKYRVHPTETIMLLAHRILISDPDSSQHRWPHLNAAVMSQEGSVPFLAWYGDFTSCNYKNWNNTHSIPLFTTCGKARCEYAFPMPTYKTIKDSHESSLEWNEIMNKYSNSYPWEKKTRRVLWRGGLTGMLKNYQSPRARLARFGKIHREEKIFDIGLTGVPDKVMQFSRPNVALLGGLHRSMPMDDFQQYIAILDTDGNSWSSRFGQLLCYNSVVVKVEPRFVDYFHFKDLIPWKHYIPVKYDLSDLLEIGKFVTDSRNEQVLRYIVRNANNWCRTRMVFDSIAHDLLDNWNEYVRFLKMGDPGWMKEWEVAKQSILASSDYEMIPVSFLHAPKRHSNGTEPFNFESDAFSAEEEEKTSTSLDGPIYTPQM